MARNELIRVVREFTGSLTNPYDLDELLHRLMGHAMEVVDAAGAGVMLARDGRDLGFVAASDDRVIEAEQAQARLKSGACFHAYLTNEIVVVEDLAADERWPEYARHVVDLGLRAVLGIPMNACGQTIGVINIYREGLTSWSDEQIEVAEIITAMGAGYILNANQLRAQHTLSEQLQAAIESRDVIGQAKGILMAQERVDADTAFEGLRARSQRENRRLRDVAEQIVRGHGETS